jgi:hypothetical protein
MGSLTSLIYLGIFYHIESNHIKWVLIQFLSFAFALALAMRSSPEGFSVFLSANLFLLGVFVILFLVL